MVDTGLCILVVTAEGHKATLKSSPINICEITFDKVAGCEITFDKVAGCEITFDKVAGCEMSFDKVAGCEITFDKVEGCDSYVALMILIVVKCLPFIGLSQW